MIWSVLSTAGPHILFFPLLPGEERMQFESLRRGEIPPDLENQEPDEEE